MAELPTDAAELRAFALACQSELKTAELGVQLKTLEIEKLEFQIAKLRRMPFGRSSERINRQIEKLELQLEELEAGAAEAVAKDEEITRYEAAAEAAEPLPTASVTSPSTSRCRSISAAPGGRASAAR